MGRRRYSANSLSSRPSRPPAYPKHTAMATGTPRATIRRDCALRGGPRCTSVPVPVSPVIASATRSARSGRGVA